MKQFTRRASAKQQLDTEEAIPQQQPPPSSSHAQHSTGQQQRKSNSKTAAVAAAASPDPYNFDIEDGSAQDKGTTTSSKPRPKTEQPAKPAAPQGKLKRPCNPISTAAPGSAAGEDEQEDQPQPSPPKQPRAAGARHVASAAAAHQQQATNATQAKAATARAPSPAAPTGSQPHPQQAHAPASGGGRGQRSGGPAQQRSRAGSGGSGRGQAAAAAAAATSGGGGGSVGKPAGSGGARRPSAAAGSKRSRGGATAAPASQQRSTSSPTDSAVPGSVISPPSNGQSNHSAGGPAGAVSLPTPHRRSRLSAGLAAAAAAAGGTEARPAQTVMEAQERGELVQMQDDASYAMDGMGPTCSIDTQRDSAVTLAEMLATRKGRVALRADGLAQQFLTSLAKLKAGKDAVLDLAATLSLWHLAAEDANPCYLASVAAAVLVDQLLQHDYTFDEVAAKSAAGAKLCRVLRTRPLVNVLASAGVNSTRGLLLVTLEQATSSVHASKAAAVEKLKHNLRQHGALQRLAGLVAESAAAPGGPVAAASQLNLLLLVLENATFTCPENGTALAELQLGAGSKSGSKGAAKQQQQGSAASSKSEAGQQQFPAALVGVAQQLLQGVDQEQSRAALHSLLSVMMNLIHDNKQGGALLCSLGGMDVAADVLSRLLQPSAGAHEALSGAVLQHLELLSVALGVLMNLVSNEPQHSRQLAAAGADDGGNASGGVSSFVRLLCTVMTALGQLLQRMEQDDTAADQAAAADDSPLGGAAAGAAAAAAGCTGASSLPSGAKVVTSPSAAAEALGSNTASEASIVELYSGILLGFLVRDGGPGLAQAVAALLPGCSLDPLTSATARCLEFYMRTGAITDHTRTTLEGLLKQLTALKQQPVVVPEAMEVE